MKTVKIILGLLLGLVIGSVVNMSIINLGGILIAMCEGIDPSNMND